MKNFSLMIRAFDLEIQKYWLKFSLLPQRIQTHTTYSKYSEHYGPETEHDAAI